MQFKMKRMLKLRFFPIRPHILKKNPTWFRLTWFWNLLFNFKTKLIFFSNCMAFSKYILTFNRNNLYTQSFYFLANNCHIFWGQKICNKHWVSESRLKSFAESKSQMCSCDRFGIRQNKTTVSNFIKEKSICDFKVAWLY